MHRSVYLIFIFLFAPLLAFCDGRTNVLYRSLDPHSLSQALAFYELYPSTQEGQEALHRARILFAGRADFPVERLLAKINSFELGTLPDFTEDELKLIENLAAGLPNRKLKGYKVTSEEELLTLAPEEIDLGRALLLTEGKQGEEVRKYLAFLDLMALSIRTRLQSDATAAEKIRAINDFLFCEKRFHFPPHSLYEKRIERYTFLSSVVTGHLGVCLGVSALYLAIAERLDLPLEIVTPPGHIYVRYNDGLKHIVIETTARGREIDEEKYWNVNMKRLQERNKKEVLGEIHINAASTALQGDDFEFAVTEYEKAKPYLKDNLRHKELLAYSYLLSGHKEKGVALFKEIIVQEDKDHITRETIPEDYLKGAVDEEGIRAILMAVNDKRADLFEKEKKLKAVLQKFPAFREGLHQLAATQLSLHHHKEALTTLERYHEMDSHNPLVEYYLTELYHERKDFRRAWFHLHLGESLIQGKGCECKAFFDLKREMLDSSPEG